MLIRKITKLPIMASDMQFSLEPGFQNLCSGDLETAFLLVHKSLTWDLFNNVMLHVTLHTAAKSHFTEQNLKLTRQGIMCHIKLTYFFLEKDK